MDLKKKWRFLPLKRLHWDEKECRSKSADSSEWLSIQQKKLKQADTNDF